MKWIPKKQLVQIVRNWKTYDHVLYHGSLGYSGKLNKIYCSMKCPSPWPRSFCSPCWNLAMKWQKEWKYSPENVAKFNVGVIPQKKEKLSVEFHLIFLYQSKELHKYVHLVTCPLRCLLSSMGNKLLVYKNILVFILVDICKTNCHCFSLAAVRCNTCLLDFFPRCSLHLYEKEKRQVWILVQIWFVKPLPWVCAMVAFSKHHYSTK